MVPEMLTGTLGKDVLNNYLKDMLLLLSNFSVPGIFLLSILPVYFTGVN